MDAVEEKARTQINQEQEEVGKGCEVFNFETYESFKEFNECQCYISFQRPYEAKTLFTIHDKYVVPARQSPKQHFLSAERINPIFIIRGRHRKQ